jgi:hypothetical protein
MAKDPTLKKKRKSEAVAMEVDAPAEGTTSAVAVEADVSLSGNELVLLHQLINPQSLLLEL